MALLKSTTEMLLNIFKHFSAHALKLNGMAFYCLYESAERHTFKQNTLKVCHKAHLNKNLFHLKWSIFPVFSENALR